MIITGWRRALQNSDLWSLNPNDRSQTVAPKLAENWQKQVDTRSIPSMMQSQCNLIIFITALHHIKQSAHLEVMSNLIFPLIYGGIVTTPMPQLEVEKNHPCFGQWSRLLDSLLLLQGS